MDPRTVFGNENENETNPVPGRKTLDAVPGAGAHECPGKYPSKDINPSPPHLECRYLYNIGSDARVPSSAGPIGRRLAGAPDETEEVWISSQKLTRDHLCPVHASRLVSDWWKTRGNTVIPCTDQDERGTRHILYEIKSVDSFRNRVSVGLAETRPNEYFRWLMQQWEQFVYDYVQSVHTNCPYCTRTVLVWASYIKIRGYMSVTALTAYPKLADRLRELGFDTNNAECCVSFMKFVENWFCRCLSETECEMRIGTMITTIQFRKEQELAGIRYPISFSDMDEAFLSFDKYLVDAWKNGFDIRQLLGL